MKDFQGPPEFSWGDYVQVCIPEVDIENKGLRIEVLNFFVPLTPEMIKCQGQVYKIQDLCFCYPPLYLYTLQGVYPPTTYHSYCYYFSSSWLKSHIVKNSGVTPC